VRGIPRPIAVGPGRLRKAWLAGAVLCLGGCAPAFPTMSGGSTTPSGRVEMSVGGAARVPLGDLGSRERLSAGNDEQSVELLGFTRRGGMSPLATVSLPLGSRLDMGLHFAGSALELHLRRGFEVGKQVTLIGGLAPLAGWLLLEDEQEQRSAVGWRVGAHMPWVLAINIGGIYEAWLGARAGVEHGQCELGEEPGSIEMDGEVYRLGALLGVGIGFRSLHALMELTADREWWRVGGDIAPGTRTGFSLTPAFALRLRI